MANEAYAKFVGATREALLAQNFHELASWQTTTLLGDCLAALKLQTSQQREAHVVTSFGRDVWFEYRILPRHLKGQVHLLIQFFDLTEHKRLEEELRHLAFHDSLTRLPNRRLLLDRLTQALRLGKRESSYLAVLFIDLNRFKQLNDTFGHDTGDQMLVEVANRLQRIVRDSDTVARFGGDEFAVLLAGLGTDSERAAQYAESVAEKIHNALRAEYVLGHVCHRASASIGTKVLVGGDHDPDQILKEADAAMYETKRRSLS
jgi:diguanylate cyclase (GGDEF)-like protein/PAS domain S-box-containing protein